MKLVLLSEARQRFEQEDAWWRHNRDEKDLFLEEFSAVLSLISTMPEVGQRYRRTRGKLIQRVLVKKTRCHVYYFHGSRKRRRGGALGLERAASWRPKPRALALA